MDAFVPMLFCRGTHRQIGYRMGKTFKEAIHEYYDLFEDLHEKFLPFYATEKGRQVCEDYLEVVRSSFPQYLDEMEGIADGAELPFVQVLLMHLRVELQSYLQTDMVPECSTVFVNNENTCALAHNEDTSTLVRNRGYLVDVHVVEERGRGKHNVAEERFVSYCYPGVVPGNSMNFTKSGLVLTMNALYPALLKLKRTPRQIINRASLAAQDISSLRKIFLDKGNGITTGCSVNVAYIEPSGKHALWNFELAPSADHEESVVSEKEITEGSETESDGSYNHFNAYKHLEIPELPGRTTSSVHRQAAADKLPVPHDVHGMLVVLGNTDDKTYPIYRTPSQADSGDTVATGVFDFTNACFTMYVANPKESLPVLTLPLPFHIKQ